MFERILSWLRPSDAEREEARRLAQRAGDVAHGLTYEHLDGVLHTHDHAHGDHQHEHDHS